MKTPLIPQEIYLLERYSSLDYYRDMRDAWVKMLDVAEEAMREFMLKLPPDHRKRSLPEQYDITWGEVVLPNFRSTRESVDAGYIMLAAGDLSALVFGGNVNAACRGQCQDFPADWMPKEQEKQFWYWQGEASTRASNMSHTHFSGWNFEDLTDRYDENGFGPLTPPETWPIYRLNPAVTVTTGEPVKQSGIYLPACDDSCASLLIKDYEAFEATVGYDPVSRQNTSMAATTWTLIERIADTGGGSHAEDLRAREEARRLRERCEDGDPCPQEGYWYTHALPSGAPARYFKQGQIMPKLESFNASIWLFSSDQSPRKT
jgi:hypothetical protein